MSYVVVKLSDTLVKNYQYEGEVVQLQDKENPHIICRIGKRSKTFSLNYTVRGVRRIKKLGKALTHRVVDIRKKALKLLIRASDGFGADFEIVNDIIDEPYMTHVKTRQKSFKPELSKLENHIRPFFGHLEFDQITPAIIDCFIEEKLETLSYSTIDKLSAIARKIGRFAVESGAHPINPFISWKQFNRDNTRTETLLPQQVQPFINCCKADNSEVPRDALLLCLGSGGRIGELMRIKVSDVNLDNKIIKLPTTKSQKPQVLLLNTFTIDIVKRRMEKATNEWLFPSTRNVAHHISYPRACYARVQARMLALGHDISNLRNHDLRRVFTTLAYSSSKNLLTVSRLIHHGSLKVTERYLQYQDDTLLETSEAVADVLLGN